MQLMRGKKITELRQNEKVGLKMSVDVEYIPSCCIEKMHLHAAIFDLPVETEVVNEPTSAENFSRFLNLHVHVLS